MLYKFNECMKKRLEVDVAHHRLLRRSLHVSRHDKITNKTIREWIGKEDVQRKLLEED